MSTFASFNYPRKFFMLPRGTLADRMKARRSPRVTGDYYQSVPRPNNRESSFYLASDFMPGLRWEYAGESRQIKHTGWFIDDWSGDTVSGLVMRLPRSRGFVPGWTLGEGMASGIEYKVFEDFDDCAMYADEIARVYAENERETRRNED